MSVDKSEGAATTIRNWKYWCVLAGAISCLGGILVSVLGVGFESDLLKAIALFSILAGYTLAQFPEYLRLRLWPWLATSLPFALIGAIALLVQNIPLVFIGALASLGCLCLASGLRRRKSKQQVKA